MKCSILLLLHLLALLQSAKSHASDCTYDRDTSHVEYICDGSVNERFNRRNLNYLYCSNYSSEIKRENVRILSFRCKNSQLLA